MRRVANRLCGSGSTLAVMPEVFANMGREFDELLNEFWPGPRADKAAVFHGAAEIWEDESALHLEFDVPGVKSTDVQVQVHDNHLILSLERKPVEGRQPTASSRRYGRVERRWRLSDGLQTEGVNAELNDGVLHITLPKRPEAQPRTVPVSSRSES